MFDLILQDIFGRNPSECSEEDLDRISRTLTLREMKEALNLAFTEVLTYW